MHLGRLNSDGGKDWLPFFTDFINWKKVFTLPERSFLAGAQGIRSRLLRGTEFWVLLNFDNVLEAPRSIRRNHHCGIRTNWTYAKNKISIAFLYLAQYLSSLLLYLKHDAIEISDPGSVEDACHMNFVIDLAHRKVSVVQCLSIRARNPTVWGSIPHGDSEFFFVPRSWQDEKHLPLIFE